MFLAENLTLNNQELFYLARNLKKNLKLSATWKQNQQVYLRKLKNEIIQVTSNSDLNL